MRNIPTWIWVVLALLVLTGGGVAAVYMTRGLRNNNPGDIKLNPNNPWLGKIYNNTDGVFEQFDSMARGIRALGKVLDSYARRGLNTVASIVPEFSATDQEAYVANLCEWLNVAPDQFIDVRDPQNRFKLVRAIILQEQGQAAALTISDSTVHEGLALA